MSDILFVGGPYSGLRGVEAPDSGNRRTVRGLHGEHLYVRFHGIGDVSFYRYHAMSVREAFKLLPDLIAK